MIRIAIAVAGVAVPQAALAAEGFDGAALGFVWALPFIGMLLSIALFPLFAHHFWEAHYGKVAAFWAVLILVAMSAGMGFDATLAATAHTMFLEYIPFILLLLALFTVSGGILVRGNIHGAPATNTALLALGAVLANFVGTTGAAMMLIRPLLRANDDRKHNAHVVIFFIFLVANIGGSLTPLGDPPLFLGFLRGVDFFWTTRNILLEMLLVSAILLALFYAIDLWVYKKEGRVRPDPTPDNPVRVVGKVNFLLIAAIIGAILLSANIDLGTFVLLGTEIDVTGLLRDVALITITLVSLVLTPKAIRSENAFTWGPILEVAKLFFAIFVTIIPVLAMLRAGVSGTFAPVVNMVTDANGQPIDAAYFWLTGSLSAFLDNAPTYLVFFELAGNDPNYLMNEGARTLAAISSGAVFMGAITYIGNAPNFMVYAMARTAGVRMPGFFGYMGWSIAILIPVFLLATVVFFL